MARLYPPQSGASSSLLANTFDFIGDSRSEALHSAAGGLGHGLASNHWFTWLRAQNLGKYKLGLVLGISGKTTDQYINTNLSQALASKSGWLVFDKPCVNDLSAQANSGVFPYTDTNGTTITQTNVGTQAALKVIAAAEKARAVGKKILITAEPGSTGLTQASTLGQAFIVSDLLKAYADATPGVYFYDPRPVIYAPTSSAIAVAFKSGYSSDGTHAFPAMSFAEAAAVKTLLDPHVTGGDYGPAHIADVNATYTRQMWPNPLFNTLTGGTRTTIGGTGSVPSGLTISGAASSTCNITSAANANGFGNDVTFTLTSTGADTFRMVFAPPSNTLWTLSSYLDFSVDMDVAAGASNATVPMLLHTVGAQVNSVNTSFNVYDLCAPAATWLCPTSAYSARLHAGPTQALTVMPGAASQWFIQPNIYVTFAGAGSLTFTLRRPNYKIVPIYANGAFTG
jgi:hypothetical protein